MTETVPLRVLHLVRPAAGGIRQHVLHLIRYFDPAAVSSSLAASSAFLDGLPPDLPLSARFELDIAPRLAPLADLKAARRLRTLLTPSLDIVHAHGLRAAWIAALASCFGSFPWVATLHNLLGHGRLTKLAIRFVTRYASHFIVVSPAIADELIAFGVSQTKISVIPNGIPIADYVNAPMVDRGEWGLTPNAFVVGCIARLSQEKGVDVLADAAALMSDVSVLVAGDGPERVQLASKSPQNMQYLGRIADVRALLSISDLIAIPSRSEGQGIVALEAMASGVALVASRVGGLAEMLDHENTALLVPPDDAKALRDAILRLQNDPELSKRLATNAALLVRQKYDVMEMTQNVAGVYRSAVGKE